MRRVIATGVLVLALAACGDDGDEEGGGGLGDLVSTTTTEAPEETTTTTEAPEETTTTSTTEATDVEIELPDGWSAVETDDFVVGLPEGWIDGEAMMSDPALADYVASLLGGEAQAQQAIAQVDLIAYEEASLDTDFGNNVNIVAGPRGPRDELDLFEAQVQSELEPLNATVNSVERTEVAGHEALEVSYTIPVEGMQVDGLMFVVLTEDLTSTLTFTATADTADPELYRRIAGTFQPIS